MAQRTVDTCSECGAENVEVTIVNDVDWLCDECLNRLDYIECDQCRDFYTLRCISFYKLKDTRMLCQFCFEDEDLSDDEVEEVWESDY